MMCLSCASYGDSAGPLREAVGVLEISTDRIAVCCGWDGQPLPVHDDVLVLTSGALELLATTGPGGLMA